MYSECQCQMRSGRKCMHNYGNAVWPLADPVAPDHSSQLVGPVMRFLWVRTKSNPKITKEKVVGLVLWTRNNTASSLQAVSSLRIATKTQLSLGSDPSCRMRQQTDGRACSHDYHYNVKCLVACRCIICIAYIASRVLSRSKQIRY